MIAERGHKAYWGQFYRLRTEWGHCHTVGHDCFGPYLISEGWNDYESNTFVHTACDLSDWGQVEADANAWSEAEFVKWAESSWLHQHQVFLNY